MKRRLTTLTVVALAVATAVATPAAAQTTWYAVDLAGDRAGGDPDGRGVAAVGFDGTDTRFYIWVTSIEQPTAAHIHTGAAGANGGVAIDLEASFSEVASGVFVAHGEVTNGVPADVLADPAGFYVNVHNADYPAGAVRGQVLGDGPSAGSLAATLRGFRQVGAAGDPDGDGFGLVTFLAGAAYAYLSAENIDEPTAAHIHMGAAGSNGSVVVDLMASFSDGVSVTNAAVDGDVAASILDAPGHYYFNIHNGEFPSGAIRGQLRETETVAFFPVISRAVGQAGSKWTTGMHVLGLADEVTTAVAEWYPDGDAGNSSPSETATLSLFPGELAVITDAVGTLFGANGNGAVKIASTEPFRAAARIFNDQRDNPDIGGTFGQAAPAYSAGDILASGVLLLGSNRPSGDGEGFRSNVGYFNPWPESVTLDIDVRDAGGSVLGDNTLTLAPLANRIRGVFDLVPSVPQGDRRQDDLLVTFSASRPVLMYLSAVDNVTNDAIFVAAEAAPMLANADDNAPPEGTITSPAGDVTIDAGQTVDFQGAASDPDGDDLTFHWDFGDGISSTELSPGDHTYSDAGTYTVVFTVTDAHGAPDPTPDMRTITVQDGGGGEATFTRVQTEIFSASCAFSGCHGGGSASAGLALDSGVAHGNIVDVPSTQSSLDRIEPNDPGASYLFLKVIDDPSITGSRMPRGGAPLSQTQIDLLRDWIERGAPND